MEATPKQFSTKIMWYDFNVETLTLIDGRYIHPVAKEANSVADTIHKIADDAVKNHVEIDVITMCGQYDCKPKRSKEVLG